MYNFVLGTICSLLCSILLGWSTFSKNKKGMMKLQTFNPIFGALSNFFFCSYSAVVINLINVVRNYLTYKGKMTKIITIVCIFFYIFMGLVFNSKNLIGLFPILASSSYAVFCLNSNNEQVLRYGLILNQLLWLVHDLCLLIYPSIIIEILISVVAIYNVLKYKQRKVKIK